jgi:hypothetical protein
VFCTYLVSHDNLNGKDDSESTTGQKRSHGIHAVLSRYDTQLTLVCGPNKHTS